MHLVHSIIWLSTVALMVHCYSHLSQHHINDIGMVNQNYQLTNNSRISSILVASLRRKNGNAQDKDNDKDNDDGDDNGNGIRNGQTKSPQAQSPTPDPESVIRDICKRLCRNGNACPPECSEVYLDPWTLFASPSAIGTLKSKRRVGMDGLTFEDYLFMRWLGRDISRRGLN